MTRDTRTCPNVSLSLSGQRRLAYRTAHAHLNKQQSLLEPRQPAQVHGGKTADGHRADTIEQAIDVGHMEVGIGRIEDAGEYQRRECAKQTADQYTVPLAAIVAGNIGRVYPRHRRVLQDA